MAPHSSTLAWKIPWMEEPGRLQSTGSLRVGHDWATSLSLFTFLHWRRKWQPTPVFLPGESQGRGSLVGCRLWGHRVGHDWSDLAAVVINSVFQHSLPMCTVNLTLFHELLTILDIKDSISYIYIYTHTQFSYKWTLKSSLEVAFHHHSFQNKTMVLL